MKNKHENYQWAFKLALNQISSMDDPPVWCEVGGHYEEDGLTVSIAWFIRSYFEPFSFDITGLELAKSNPVEIDAMIKARLFLLRNEYMG